MISKKLKMHSNAFFVDIHLKGSVQPRDARRHFDTVAEHLASLAAQFVAIQHESRTLTTLLLEKMEGKKKDGASTLISTNVVAAPIPKHVRDTVAVSRIKTFCQATCLTSSLFMWVPSEYYTKPLQWRRDMLQAPSIHFLCKCIVLENTHFEDRKNCEELESQNTKGATHSNRTTCLKRFVIAVFQYTQKFDAEQLMKFFRQKNPTEGKRSFNFRVAPLEVSQELTGCTKNAMVPFCFPASTLNPEGAAIQVVLDEKVTKLKPEYLWIGGGDVDCKLRISLADFEAATRPFVVDFTTPLAEDELKSITE